MADSKVAVGDTINATSSDGERKASLKVSALSTGADMKKAVVLQIKPPSGFTYADEKYTALAKALVAKEKPTKAAAETMLKELLDSIKARPVPVKKPEGAPAAAPAAASKLFKISEVQKDVALKGKAESLFYNADAVTNAYRTESTLEAAVEKALAKMRENKPAKAAAAAAKLTEAQRAAAEKKAATEAAAEAKRSEAAAALVAKRLAAPAAGENEGWKTLVELERSACHERCDKAAAEKLAAGRPTRKAKTAGPAGNGAAAANNSGESLSSEEAWGMFTDGLPADIAAFVGTPKQKAALEKTVQYKAWVGIYAGSKSKGKTELAKYKASIQKAVGKKLAEVKAALNAPGNGASRKRRASGNAVSRGGSRKNSKTRKNHSRRNRRN